MAQLRRCPRNCYVTDTNAVRCPRCGTILKTDGPITEDNKQRIMDENAQMQKAEHPDKMVR